MVTGRRPCAVPWPWSCSTWARWCTTTSSTTRRCDATRPRCTSRWACRSRSGPATRCTPKRCTSPSGVTGGGVALGDALRRIADSQILEALGATTARYWDVVDGKTVSLFDATFALADEAAGGSLPGIVREAVHRYGRLFQYVDDLQDIGGE